MSATLSALIASALLSLALAALTIVIHLRAYGGKVIRGNRDDYPPLGGMAGRVVRAHANLNEALLPFAIICGAALTTGVADRTTAWAAAVFFVARLAHAGFYLAGASPWRSVAFYAGLGATLVIACQLLLGSLL